MKRLFCGLLQHKSRSSNIESTSSRKSKTNSKTNMAANTTNQAEWYTIELNRQKYTLPVRYQNPVFIGQGTFGAVIRATDTQTGEHVAIKKMVRPFQTLTDAKRTYRELKLLMCLNHPSARVVQLYNVFTPERSLNDFQTLYFVFKFADSDLHKVIQRNEPFTENEIRKIIYSLLCGLKFIHSAGILHRDLKPTNIGIDRNEEATILDFGLARVASSGIQTGYVSTKWWRAPEIYLNWERYDEKIDIWCVGCVMAELILLEPVFRGSDYLDQLNKIFDTIGTPDLATSSEICPPESVAYISGLLPKPKKDFKELFGFKYGASKGTPISGVSPQGVKLLDSLLSYDYRLRPTAEEALAHEFFKSLRNPMKEPVIGRLVDEHEDKNYTMSQWKSIIWQMVEEFSPRS